MIKPSIQLGMAALLVAAAEAASSTATYTSGNPQRWYSTGAPFIVLDTVAFVLQSNGNLVAASISNEQAVWNSGTTSQNCANSNCFLQWQGDGNLVLYQVENGSPTAYYSTGTTAGSSLHPQQAGQVIFRDSAPYIELQTSSGTLEWYTSGSNSYVAVNNRPSPPPCGGGKRGVDCIPPA